MPITPLPTAHRRPLLCLLQFFHRQLPYITNSTSISSALRHLRFRFYLRDPLGFDHPIQSSHILITSNFVSPFPFQVVLLTLIYSWQFHLILPTFNLQYQYLWSLDLLSIYYFLHHRNKLLRFILRASHLFTFTCFFIDLLLEFIAASLAKIVQTLMFPDLTTTVAFLQSSPLIRFLYSQLALHLLHLKNLLVLLYVEINQQSRLLVFIVPPTQVGFRGVPPGLPHQTLELIGFHIVRGLFLKLKEGWWWLFFIAEGCFSGVLVFQFYPLVYSVPGLPPKMQVFDSNFALYFLDDGYGYFAKGVILDFATISYQISHNIMKSTSKQVYSASVQPSSSNPKTIILPIGHSLQHWKVIHWLNLPQPIHPLPLPLLLQYNSSVYLLPQSHVQIIGFEGYIADALFLSPLHLGRVHLFTVFHTIELVNICQELISMLLLFVTQLLILFTPLHFVLAELGSLLTLRALLASNRIAFLCLVRLYFFWQWLPVQDVASLAFSGWQSIFKSKKIFWKPFSGG